MPPAVLCDSYQDCLDGSDEANCIGTETCTSTENLGSQTLTLVQRNRCSVPNELYLVCQDYRDQLNCSHVLESPLICKVGGYLTTVSRYALCKETSLCDNGLDKNCDAAEGGCVIHKHQFCDGHKDCHEGKDEDNSICESLTKQTCERKFSSSTPTTEQLIPLSWVADGVEDCLNGKDEDKDSWKVCGEGWTKRYLDSGTSCSDVFLSSNISYNFEEYGNLCDRSGDKETEICEVSRNLPWIQCQVMVRYRGCLLIGYYLPGLENLETNYYLKNHSCIDFVAPDRPFGVQPKQINIAISSSSNNACNFVYGELYVYLTCSGYCYEVPCILTPVKHDSCHNIKDHRVFSLSEKNYLTIATKIKGQYVSNLFSCNNGYCITYDKVCNLVDDCGDRSDEVNCLNHFQCEESGEMIPISSVNDGSYDCGDFSDECSNTEQIIDGLFLTVVSWVIGILAFILNAVTFVTSFPQLKAMSCPYKLLNQLMILLISLGDLMVGLYLIVLSVVNILLKDTYCKERFLWLTSGYCAAMGVVSSTGSQISLFAMVVLGVSRMKMMSRTSMPSNRNRSMPLKQFVAMIAIALTVLISSITISYIPLMDKFEDFFVNGLFYNPEIKLFIGTPSKQKHIAILEKYYSKFRGNPNLPWSTVRRLVRNMFSQNYGGVNGVKLHFYGNDGVCLFKYFVTPDDPQASYSLSVLLINFLSFLIITFSYTFIHLKSTSSTRKIGNNAGRRSRRRELAMQRKLAMMILTDFLCWIPFILVSVLHYMLVFDASPWYAILSVLILPINSVINPLLYNSYIGKVCSRIRKSNIWKCVKCRASLSHDNPLESAVEMQENTVSPDTRGSVIVNEESSRDNVRVSSH